MIVYNILSMNPISRFIFSSQLKTKRKYTLYPKTQYSQLSVDEDLVPVTTLATSPSEDTPLTNHELDEPT